MGAKISQQVYQDALELKEEDLAMQSAIFNEDFSYL